MHSVEKDDWLTTDAESGDDDDATTFAKEAASDVRVGNLSPSNKKVEEEIALESCTLDSGVGTIFEQSSEEKELYSEGQMVDSQGVVETLDPKQLEEKVARNLQELGDNTIIRHWGPKALHTRKFREYCTHFVDTELNALVKSLMLELMRFQDKIYHKEKEAAVNMFKTKRRFFNGLREVLKYVKLKKLKLLIVASDVESIRSTGGLDDVMDQILQEAKEQRVFTVFTMSRFALGKILKKPVPISCVGVRDYGGCETFVKELKKKVEQKTEEYDARVEEIRAKERMERQNGDDDSKAIDGAASGAVVGNT